MPLASTVWAAVALDGAMWANDISMGRFQIFDQGGDFYVADGIALDGQGGVYITDSGAAQVVKCRLLPPLAPEGTPTT
ncbi:MAG: hypothetical protein ACRDJW_14410 [Thermomicrobiales bacterium]